jgi:chromosome segregation ATPase
VEKESISFEALRLAHQELARRVAVERLAFADRVQEVLDDVDRLQTAIDERDERLRALGADAEALRERVVSLHAELQEAHRNQQALEASRSYRYTAFLRRAATAFRRP